MQAILQKKPKYHTYWAADAGMVVDDCTVCPLRLLHFRNHPTSLPCASSAFSIFASVHLIHTRPLAAFLSEPSPLTGGALAFLSARIGGVVSSIVLRKGIRAKANVSTVPCTRFPAFVGVLPAASSDVPSFFTPPKHGMACLKHTLANNAQLTKSVEIGGKRYTLYSAEAAMVCWMGCLLWREWSKCRAAGRERGSAYLEWSPKTRSARRGQASSSQRPVAGTSKKTRRDTIQNVA